MRFRTKFVPLFLEGVVVRRQSKCGRDILRGAGGASQHTVTTLQPRKQTRTGTCFWGLCICPGMEVLPGTALSGDGGTLTKPLWRYPPKFCGNIAEYSWDFATRLFAPESPESVGVYWCSILCPNDTLFPPFSAVNCTGFCMASGSAAGGPWGGGVGCRSALRLTLPGARIGPGTW